MTGGLWLNRAAKTFSLSNIDVIKSLKRNSLYTPHEIGHAYEVKYAMV